MDYIPSNYEQQMHRFFQKRKIALNTIEKLGIKMPYISEKLTFEQLFLEYTIKDISRNETDYLKEGIKSLIECLKEIQKIQNITKEYTYNEVYIKNKEYADKFLNTKDHDNITKWLEKKSEFLFNSLTGNKIITEEVLIREIAEFKTRLGRVNVIVDIQNDTLKFNDKKKMEQLIIYSKEIIENPYPHIFVDADAFILFRELHSIYKDIENPLANYSFIYRQMAEKDKLIKDSFKPEKFRNWLNSEPFELDINTKLKIYDKCFTKEKQIFYQYVKSKQ